MGTTPPPYNSIDVANLIIEHGEKTGNLFTPMALLKLVYIAHGFHLAVFQTSLIKEKVEAWKYGPVIPELYDQISKYKHNDIEQKLKSGETINFDTNSKKLVKLVIDKYKRFDALKLSALTHQTGTPWHIVWNDPSSDDTIPIELMTSYYKEFISR